MLKTALAAALLCVASFSVSAQQVRPVDAADAATTAAAIGLRGATEANPIIGLGGDAAAPIAAIGVKLALKTHLMRQGVSEKQADQAVGYGSAFGACNNVAVLFGAIAPPAFLAGLGCVAVYHNANPPQRQVVLREDGQGGVVVVADSDDPASWQRHLRRDARRSEYRAEDR